MVHDIRWLLEGDDEKTAGEDAVYLWDDKIGTVSNGINYFDDEEGGEEVL